MRSPIPAETVQFLLVHHTSEPGSEYEPGEVEGLLRQIYNFHTGAEKGWPDIAYNFFVDKFGTIWEGRTGSADGPLQGSATGGNQGFSQLCCFLGDFESEPPPDAAVASMIALLAWLAGRYDVDMTPGAMTTFTSRESNLWPEGTEVTTPTISTHRQMSQTSCPGTACHELVVNRFQTMVSAQLPATTAPTTAASTAQPSTTVATTAAPTAVGGEPQASPGASSTAPGPDEQAAAGRSLDPPAKGGTSKLPIALGAVATATVAGGALAWGLHSRSGPGAPAAAHPADINAIPAVPSPATAYRPVSSRQNPADHTSSAVSLAARSPVLWWSTATPPGSSGVATNDGLGVFWMAGADYSAGMRDHIEASMRASVSKVGGAADVSLGPWFTQMLTTILPSGSHPPSGGLILGATTSSECVALSTGIARIEVPGATGSHKPRPGLPGIDQRSGTAHRWAIPAGGAWLTGWIRGPGTLSVDPGLLAARIDREPDGVAALLGGTEGYLGVRLGGLIPTPTGDR